MKKTILLSSILAVGLVGCSNDDATTKETKASAPEQTQEVKKESKYPFPSDATEIGEGSIIVNTPSGTSENGSLPAIMVEADTVMTQVGLDLTNFDGSKHTYIYINEMFVKSDQVGSRTQTSLSLEGDLLEKGKYEVAAIQFENDDPASGKVIQLVTAKYEVK